MPDRPIAIITGGSRGIGASVAKRLAASGMACKLVYSSDDKGVEKTIGEIEAAGGDAMSIKADLACADSLDAIFAQLDRIDVLVNNAGIEGAAPMNELGWDFLSRVIDVNLKAALMSSVRALPLFPESGGSIINVSSLIATQPMAGQLAYAASKAGLESATRVMAQELGSRAIRVNAVAPGPVNTALVPEDDNIRAFLQSRTPLGRIGEPEDIANAIEFLVSKEASWITGHVLRVDGGFRV